MRHVLNRRQECCAFIAGATSVPLPTNIQAEDIVKIVNEAEITCLICSLAELPNLASLVGGCKTVKTFVVMDLPSRIDSDTKALMKKARADTTHVVHAALAECLAGHRLVPCYGSLLMASECCVEILIFTSSKLCLPVASGG